MSASRSAASKTVEKVPVVYLGLGSNIDPQEHLEFALDELEHRFGALESSSVYRSRAYGFDGDDFLNMVVRVETEATPEQVHAELEEIHEAAGRNRDARGYSPRTLDIDLLLYDDLVVNRPPIRLPRPDVLRFSFVLGPLAEIAPLLVHPETHRTIENHWDDFDDSRHPITKI
jgi:2-amino-4-hydroxy-6-hydroxymethyldihydropteridine diphosphokinase